MKKLLIGALLMFVCTAGFAEQITINWLNEDKTINQTTTCTIGGDVILPTAPTKYGYTFQGWTTNFVAVEYLESVPGQYIDTGVVGDLYTKISTKFEPLATSVQGNSEIIAGNLRQPESAISVLITMHNAATRTCRFGDKKIEFPQNKCVLNNQYVLETDRYTITLNGETMGTFNATNYFQTDGNLYMFTVDTTTGAVAGNAVGSIRMYYFKIYENNVLVRDFIPVIDSNGVPCMYDKIDQRFYYNAGAGQFVAGPVI